MMGMGEKTQKRNRWNQGKKISPFGCPPIPSSTKMKADCFPVSENNENKRTYPRWDRGPSLVGQRNTGLGAVWVDRSR